MDSATSEGEGLGRVREGYGGKGWWGVVMPTVNPKIKTQHPAEAKCNATVIKAFPSTNESAGKRSIVNWIIYHHRDRAAAAMVTATAAAAVWRPINGSCIKRSAVCPWKVTWWLFSTFLLVGAAGEAWGFYCWWNIYTSKFTFHLKYNIFI